MVFEDLQWADPSLLDFIDYLHELVACVPDLRDDARAPRSREAARSQAQRHVNLPGAAAGAGDGTASDRLVPGCPPADAKILERAEGVPLYAVETVRMLLGRICSFRKAAVYRPTGPIEDLEVPETLHALIAARLDGLSPPERRLIQEASVLGKTCTPAALAAIPAFPSRDRTRPRGTRAKEVLTVQADPRSPERGQYAFLQDLVRTVAYETPRKDRKAMHLSVAGFLQQAWGADEAEVVEVVASHYLEALPLAPDAEDAPRIRDLACGMLIRAGKRAASLAAPEEARAYFERAAELSHDADRTCGLLERAGRMAI